MKRIKLKHKIALAAIVVVAIAMTVITRPWERDMEDGPFSAYPISFPKVLGGILYFEVHRPDIAVTEAQCVELIPVLEEMGKSWRAVTDETAKINGLLTPEQEDFIMGKKKDMEVASGHALTRKYLNKILGVHHGVGHDDDILEFFKLRAGEGPHDSDYRSVSGIDIPITIFDIFNGLIQMEVEGDPEIRITPYQAATISPLYESAMKHNDNVSRLFLDGIMNIVTEEQVDGVVEDIRDIIPYKQEVFREGSKDAEMDPVFFNVLYLCRQKVGTQ